MKMFCGSAEPAGLRSLVIFVLCAEADDHTLTAFCDTNLQWFTEACRVKAELRAPRCLWNYEMTHFNMCSNPLWELNISSPYFPSGPELSMCSPMAYTQSPSNTFMVSWSCFSGFQSMFCGFARNSSVNVNLGPFGEKQRITSVPH